MAHAWAYDHGIQEINNHYANNDDIIDIGDDSNVDDELDASHGYDDDIDDNTVKGDEGDEDDAADDDIDFDALMM